MAGLETSTAETGVMEVSAAAVVVPTDTLMIMEGRADSAEAMEALEAVLGPTSGSGGSGIGGAIFQYTGMVTIINCSFSNNQVTGGIAAGADFYNFAGRVFPVLNATTIGGGTVTADPPNPPYLSNSVVTVSATPLSGWQFLYWLGDASGTNGTTTLNVNRNEYVQAVFGTTLTPSLLVLANPQSTFYPYGTVVKLTAVVPNGACFASWGGNGSGTNNPLSFTVTNANQNVSFQLNALNVGQSWLTVIETGYGHVTVNPYANSYANGQSVSLTAVPDAGKDFIAWIGSASGTQNPLLLTMSANSVITASFTTRPTLRVGTPLEGLVPDGFRLTILGEYGIVNSNPRFHESFGLDCHWHSDKHLRHSSVY